MVVGFLKGLWGKPAKEATGMHGLWDTVSKAPSKIIDKLMTPVKLIKYAIIGIVLIILYKRYQG